MRRRIGLLAETLILAAAALNPLGAQTASERGAGVAEPLASLQHFATQRDISLSGFETGGAAEPSVGDSVTALVTLYEGAHATQWLICSSVGATTPGQRLAKPPPPVTIYANSGGRYEFGSAWLPLEVATFGPFRPEGAQAGFTQRRSQVLVKGDFLALGLFRACSAMVKASRGADAMGREKLGLEIGTRPYPEAERAIFRGREAAAGLTVDDERAMAGLLPVLTEFMTAIQSTPGLDTIFTALIEKMWLLWTLATHGGKLSVGFSFGKPSYLPRWTSPPAAVCSLPFSLTLYGESLFRAELVVADPGAALRPCAGILRITAVSARDPAKHMEIRVIAAHSGLKPGN